MTLPSLENRISSIAFGAGCFWCVEGIFSMIEGVLSTKIGYGGGKYPNPTYKSVSSNPDGHAELTLIEYDTEKLNLGRLIEIFFSIHDPNKTFLINDKKGELYRSVIMYNSASQKRQLIKLISTYEKSHETSISTEVVPLINFKLSDEKYQNYFTSNPEKPFCRNVILPKIAKLKAKGII
jgi:methionine-S-sulfoxide reductase